MDRGDSGTPDPGPEPSLLDIVPWSYGFAHSWALRWLLLQPSLFPLVLDAIDGLDDAGGYVLAGEVLTEKPLAPARADLAFEMEHPTRPSIAVGVETKVTDPYRPDQLSA